MKFKRTLILVIALVLIAFLSVPSLAQEISMGTVTGTGSTINVSVGFTPRAIEVFSLATAPAMVIWRYGMATGCLKIVNDATAANVVTNTSTPCIGTYAGSITAGKGFTIYGDSDLNISGYTLYWKATK